MSGGLFHASVGVLVRRSSDGKYLLLKRSPDKDFGSGAWECVSGRVEQGESSSVAVIRQVETLRSLASSELLDFYTANGFEV